MWRDISRGESDEVDESLNFSSRVWINISLNLHYDTNYVCAGQGLSFSLYSIRYGLKCEKKSDYILSSKLFKQITMFVQLFNSLTVDDNPVQYNSNCGSANTRERERDDKYMKLMSQ